MHDSSSHQNPATRRANGLPTLVREHLSQKNQVSIARLLDALYQQGFQPGEIVTEAAIRSVATDYRIAAKTVRQAITSEIKMDHDTRRIFERVGAEEAAFYTPDFPVVLSPDIDTLQNGDNKSRRGRPPILYRIPDPRSLAQFIGAKSMKSDPMTALDLVSNKAYRAAMHEAFITRRPGQYSRKLLSKRVGVSPRTTCTYDKIAGIQVEPRFKRTAVTAYNLFIVPLNQSEYQGGWLEDGRGRRHCAYQSVAAHLLHQGETVIYVRRTCNYYSPAGYEPDTEDEDYLDRAG